MRPTRRRAAVCLAVQGLDTGGEAQRLFGSLAKGVDGRQHESMMCQYFCDITISRF